MGVCLGRGRYQKLPFPIPLSFCELYGWIWFQAVREKAKAMKPGFVKANRDLNASLWAEFCFPRLTKFSGWGENNYVFMIQSSYSYLDKLICGNFCPFLRIYYCPLMIQIRCWLNICVLSWNKNACLHLLWGEHWPLVWSSRRETRVLITSAFSLITQATSAEYEGKWDLVVNTVWCSSCLKMQLAKSLLPVPNDLLAFLTTFV